MRENVSFDPSLIEVYASWANELKSKYKRVSKLFKHGPSIGRSRELYLAEMVSKCIPASLEVSHGCFYDPEYGASQEQDILIIDKNEAPPIEKVGDFGIYHKRSVRACIEVKSKLTKKELQKGVGTLVRARKRGIGFNTKFILFAYETTMSAETILNSIINTEDYFDFRPQLIVVLGRFVFCMTAFQPNKPTPWFELTAFKPKKRNFDLTLLELLDTVMEIDGFTPFKDQSSEIRSYFEIDASKRFNCPSMRPGSGIGTNLETRIVKR